VKFYSADKTATLFVLCKVGLF